MIVESTDKQQNVPTVKSLRHKLSASLVANGILLLVVLGLSITFGNNKMNESDVTTDSLPRHYTGEYSPIDVDGLLNVTVHDRKLATSCRYYSGGVLCYFEGYAQSFSFDDEFTRCWTEQKWSTQLGARWKNEMNFRQSQLAAYVGEYFYGTSYVAACETDQVEFISREENSWPCSYNTKNIDSIRFNTRVSTVCFTRPGNQYSVEELDAFLLENYSPAEIGDLFKY